MSGLTVVRWEKTPGWPPVGPKLPIAGHNLPTIAPNMEYQPMSDRRRLRDLGITIGRLNPGPNNAITDVDGVRVGTAHSSQVRVISSLARDPSGPG